MEPLLPEAALEDAVRNRYFIIGAVEKLEPDLQPRRGGRVALAGPFEEDEVRDKGIGGLPLCPKHHEIASEKLVRKVEGGVRIPIGLEILDDPVLFVPAVAGHAGQISDKSKGV